MANPVASMVVLPVVKTLFDLGRKFAIIEIGIEWERI